MNAVAIVLNLEPGTLYQCRESRLHYRVYGLAQHWPTMQEVVVFEGVEGLDYGVLYSCTLDHFTRKFEPVAVAEKKVTEAPLVERMVDLTSKGMF